MGLGVEGFTLTDIQYTQLMPPTGNSNIICAGRSHIYYPICLTGGGGRGKYQHSRQHVQVKSFTTDIFVELAGTLRDEGPKRPRALIIEFVCLSPTSPRKEAAFAGKTCQHL